MFATGVSGAAADTLSDRVPVEGPGVLRIQLDHGRVEVSSHASPEIRIEAQARGMGATGYAFSLHRSDEVTTLSGREESWLKWLMDGPRVTIRVWVPSDFRVEIETGDGRVDVSEVASVAAQTGDAPIRVENVAGAIDLRTAGGSVASEAVSGALALTATGRVHQVEGVAPATDTVIGNIVPPPPGLGL